ncbi:SH3 domain-containing protein [Variovorax flavidus]|uniref:SH3 domain-containing protein n=1 Tax=Variovorax flavidus TaxID=3053501 RepID=UPI003365625B
MPRAFISSLLLALSLMLALPAMAFNSSTTRSLNVRSGPGSSFRVVTVLPPRTSVWVDRCTNGWRWCEVSGRRGGRGWVDARFLSPSVRGRVPIVNDRRRPGPPPQPGPWPQRPVG